VVGLIQHPPKGGWGAIPLPFFAGILMAAAGGFMVMKFKPAPGKAPSPPAAAVQRGE
jgi:hypothetical protein